MALITKANSSQQAGTFILKDEIFLASDFPTIAEVNNFWVYIIKANVTDNDPAKTNTGLSFLVGDIIGWNGTTWIDLSGIEVWIDNGTQVAPINARSVNIQTGQTYQVNSVNLLDNDSTMAGNSSIRVATQQATKTYADNVDNNAFFYALAFG